MRCSCCDRTLSEKEISYNHDCDEWEFCGTCLIAISEVFTDHLTEDEVTYELVEEWGEEHINRDASPPIQET